MSGSPPPSGADGPRAGSETAALADLARRLQEADEEADEEAHAEAFRRFYGPLVRYARRITGSRAAADDVVQDVFLKLWERRGRLGVRTSLQAMLYTMTRNRALNAIRRRRKVTGDVAVEEARRRQGEHAPAPDEQAEAEDLRRHLRRWIGELPERRAEAFTLSRDHGLSHEEIARVMDVSKRTVDTHIYHALCDLRERLDALRGR